MAEDPQNDKPVTEHDIPSWMKTRESDPANVTPSSAAMQKHQALPDDTSLRKCPSTMIKCVQETAASFLPHVERSNSSKEFAAKAHQDSSNQEEQSLQGGPRCLNETYSKRIETNILDFPHVELLVDFLVSLLDLEKWHHVIGELWFCAKPSHIVHFTENNLAGLNEDDRGVYHIHSSDPHTETLWPIALSAAEVSARTNGLDDASHTLYVALKQWPLQSAYPYYADLSDVQSMLARVRVESITETITRAS
ncbi:hypothetical protein CABS01_10916 [Colletotrichum abscissum]|uniref:uncharacterized protein n=1 Tax=Colletotrichum abscissum TaxID=1671311 RepID=UPI0027D4C41F|nr:uncharacterized protein CABS01_10916 [Colletotrichum abscissum]KAK1496767.1 hypothetical protein CABS01_10916 [Colletotrichum abscissum]